MKITVSVSNQAHRYPFHIMTAPKLILAGALVEVFLLLFVSVESQCLACVAPYGPYCCKTSFNSKCCEYSLDRMDKGLRQLSTLERRLKEQE